MSKFVLIVLWALSFHRGLEGLSSEVIRSLEQTSTARDKGLCSTWGSGAFRTFDNSFYYFTSTCNYILSRHCKGGTEDFNIQIRRGPAGNLEHVFIQIEGVSVLIVNATIAVQDVLVSLPYNNKVISIHKHGVNTRLSNRKHTISVNWNGDDALWINVDEKYQEQLCGLCGKFDKNGSSVYDLTFLDNNKLDVLGHVCYSTMPSESTCNESSECLPIRSVFTSCVENYSQDYFKMCQADVCSCKKTNCQCDSFEEVARQCNKGEGAKWRIWRDETKCPLPTCPRNQIYQECGSACIPTCTDSNPQWQCDQCVSTCACPEGHLLDNIRGTNRCIVKSECPCEYGGLFYQSGDIKNTTCQSCVCKSGSWSCSSRSCPGTCAIEEATYFTTFDNRYYSITGDCSYYAVVTDSWTITVEIRQCQAAFKQTCLQRVTLATNQMSYVFSNDGKVYSNGQALGIPVKTGEIIIFQQSSMYIQVATAFGLKMQVQIAPLMQLYISLPVNAKGATRGLCGTFNGEAEDDFLSEQGIVESTPITFADSWKTEDRCLEPTIPSPCVSSENENYAKLHCSQLKDPAGAFSSCHSTVDYLKYYQMCVAATCACENINDCLCAALGAYAHECAANGVIVRNWRSDICSKTCVNTQVFENDMRACNRTCRSLAEYDYTCEVKDIPVFGCGCAKGKYMNSAGTCVDKSDCPCYAGELVVNKGQSTTINGRKCKCENGKFYCTAVSRATNKGCPNGKLYNDCSQTAGEKRHVQRSCRTLSINIVNANHSCTAGCVCPDDLVEDENGRCIPAEQCPCPYGGENYPSGEIIDRDCNQCKCEKGKWKCTTNKCPKTCQVYGDGQYMTFDGKRYMFDGNCEYILVQDHCNQGEGTFQILTESVPCCENGVTCSRNIKILFAEVEFLLTDGRVIRTDKSRQAQCQDNSYSFQTVGLYIILSFSNGVTVIWDKHTRLSIALDTKWQNKVCGLCGNFNEDVADELTTKDNSLVTNTARFGNSWKSSSSCSNTLNQTFPCDRNPDCLAWAQRKCNILKDDVFRKCHKMVDPIPYYEACVQEACACDMEGKYLGFCTAVAVYAEACTKAGICIHWRTPDLCPVYCDYYNSPSDCSWHYYPCGSTKTKTCSDHTIGKDYSTFLEGCYARCSENAPYLDQNRMKCVNLSDCTCYYNGKILQPGDRTRNDCEECECKNGKVTCREIVSTEKPTTTTPTTIYIPETTEKLTTTSATTSYVLETTSPAEELTTTASTISNIAETISLREMQIATSSTTIYIPETTLPPETPTTTSSTTSHIPENHTRLTATWSKPNNTNPYEPICNGVWTRWFNKNKPSFENRADVELLVDLLPNPCPFYPYNLSNIHCESVEFPNLPINKSGDFVTCDLQTGLVCHLKLTSFLQCQDYRMRVCCEPIQTTSTTAAPLTAPTIYEPEVSQVTIVPLESCWCNSNPPRKCLESWNHNCTTITCIKGDIYKVDPVVCPKQDKPTCKKGIEPVKVSSEDGCCEQWECNCQCEIWGDPHYRTFGGVNYNFFGNCTYTLVEEIVPKYNLSIVLDNYFCLPFVNKSCPMGLMIYYNENVVHISTGSQYLLTVDGSHVSLPHISETLHITQLDTSTYIYIPNIRTTIVAFRFGFEITVPEKYFLNNTRGQCGSCSSNSCVRKSGKVEPSDCCSETAYDWIVPDSNKPYCQSAPTDVPCTSAPPETACQDKISICDILREKPFEKCRRKINLNEYVESCTFDHCTMNSTADCSSLETAALACAGAGVCVDWRSSTNGTCEYSCAPGLVYKPCATKSDDQCENNEVKTGEKFSTIEEGCFCPDGLIHSKGKFKCVPFCEVCHDYSGQPRKDGDTWNDPNDPCISYSCTQYGVLINNRSCTQDETCPENHRIYLDSCCSKCSELGLCKLSSFNETIIYRNCSATFLAQQCSGHCSSVSRYNIKSNSMDFSCQCCKEDLTEEVEVKLNCENGDTRTINYVDIKSCKCQKCNKLTF
ncbi:mucin-6-like isoform X1 [Hemitrygon akajei]|uniref:mucin-6-like isoform X1 n=1 Tax=Hemitrygon akajei TaxID=2704970 RepID=UPI003BF9F876